MPHALSIVIAPSCRLRWLLAAMGAVLAAAAAGVAMAAPGRYRAVILAVAMLLAASLSLLHAALRRATQQRIDLSGPGQLHLTVQQGVRPDSQASRPVHLLPGSTVWPRMMVLRLGLDNGRCRTLVVLPDSVSPDGFRALAVALGAGREAVDASSIAHKIL